MLLLGLFISFKHYANDISIHGLYFSVCCLFFGEREREREGHFLSWQGPWKGRTHCESIVGSLILHLQMHLQEADYMI